MMGSARNVPTRDAINLYLVPRSRGSSVPKWTAPLHRRSDFFFMYDEKLAEAWSVLPRRPRPVDFSFCSSPLRSDTANHGRPTWTGRNPADTQVHRTVYLWPSRGVLLFHFYTVFFLHIPLSVSRTDPFTSRRFIVWIHERVCNVSRVIGSIRTRRRGPGETLERVNRTDTPRYYPRFIGATLRPELKELPLSCCVRISKPFSHICFPFDQVNFKSEILSETIFLSHDLSSGRAIKILLPI